MKTRLTFKTLAVIAAVVAAHGAKANDCLFELHTTGEGNITVNMRDVSSHRLQRLDGGWEVKLDMKSGKTQWLRLWEEKGARSIDDFRRTAKRCMR